ncbi:MAG: hypothetical protein OQK51_03945 [Kangiellaceae bacterium]|nr:hypothetical protein [Kangiellaceae bacterium]
MNSTLLSNTALSILSDSGWTVDRDMTSQLTIDERKSSSEEFLKIAKNMAYLKLNFRGYSGEESLYFDLDESLKSKNMRANYSGYESFDDEKWMSDPDYKETEDFELTRMVSESAGVVLDRIGFLEEELGMDIYVDSAGAIYWSHWDESKKVASSLEEFLNDIILGTL